MPSFDEVHGRASQAAIEADKKEERYQRLLRTVEETSPDMDGKVRVLKDDLRWALNELDENVRRRST
jgi:hypothetical protein